MARHDPMAVVGLALLGVGAVLIFHLHGRCKKSEHTGHISSSDCPILLFGRFRVPTFASDPNMVGQLGPPTRYGYPWCQESSCSLLAFLDWEIKARHSASV
jgi:hypothetical protein